MLSSAGAGGRWRVRLYIVQTVGRDRGLRAVESCIGGVRYVRKEAMARCGACPTGDQAISNWQGRPQTLRARSGRTCVAMNPIDYPHGGG